MQTVKPESVGISSERLERLESAMQQYVDKGIFAGIVTLISRQGEVAQLESFGWQDLETKRPMTTSTIFRIYSMSKPVTSTAAMILCEEGRPAPVGPALALPAGVQGYRDGQPGRGGLRPGVPPAGRSPSTTC